MKRISISLLAVVLSLTLANGIASAKQTSLTVWSIWEKGPGYSDDIVKLAKRYEQLHPDVKITVNMVPDAQVKLPVAIAGGAAPDVTFVNGGVISAKYAIGSYLQPIGPLMKADGVLDDYLASALRTFATWKDEVYAAPYAVDANFAMFYNIDSFEQAGLDASRPPESIEELFRYSEKLLKRQADGTLTQVGMIPWRMYGEHTALLNWSLAFGGTQYSDGVHYNLNIPSVRQALDFMIQYGDRNGGPTRMESLVKNSDITDLTHVAMQPLVSANAARIPIEYPDVQVGLSYLPKAAGGATPVWLGGQWMGIPQGAAHVQEAWKFIRWVTLDLEAIQMTVATRFAGAKAAYDRQIYTPAAIEVGLPAGAKATGQTARVLAFYAKLVPFGQPILEAAVWYWQDIATAVRQIVVDRKGDPAGIMAELTRTLNARVDLALSKAR